MRVPKMLLIVIFIMLMFNLFGLIDGDGTILDRLGILDMANIEHTDFVTRILVLGGISGALAIAGIVIGSLVGLSFDTLIYAGVTVFLVPILLATLGDMIAIYSKLSTISPILAMIIIPPMAIMFVIGVVDWVRYRD